MGQTFSIPSILEDGKIDAAEVVELRAHLYADGVIDRAEANDLFQLNDEATEKDPTFDALFVQAIADHLLKDDVSPGAIDEDEANWLIEKIKGDGKVDALELSVLVALCEKATSMPDSLSDFTLESLKDAIVEDGIVDAGEVEMLRKVIYGEGGADGSAVSRTEADLLFDINDAVSGKDNDPSYETLFVDAVSSHLLDDENSPGAVDEDEADWLIGRIEGDGVYDTAETKLLVNLKEKATDLGKLAFSIGMYT